MYEELIKRLRDAAKEQIKQLRDAAKMSEALAVLLPNSGGNVTAKLFNEAADAIEKLSMKLHGDEAAILGMKREIERMVVAGKLRWIPVTESLPEKGKWVLCNCRAEMMFIMRLVDGVKDVCWQIQSDMDLNTIGYMLSFVTHWMPLPEPPEEEVS